MAIDTRPNLQDVWSSPYSGGPRTNTCILEQDFYPSYYPALLPGPTPDPCSDTYPLPVALAWRHAEVITRQDYPFTNSDGTYYFEHLVDKFSAQAKIKLYTGGKAGINRQNLWAVSGSATEHRQIGVTSGINVPIWTNLPVPPGQITMGELGALGSDGIRWTPLPDDTTRTITPTANGPQWYDFDAGAQKYKMTIMANGYPLARDRVRPLAKYCVGQYLQFAPAWSPPLPDGTVASPVQWNFDGDYVNETWQVTQGSPSGASVPYGPLFYRKNDLLLSHENTSAWWTSGGNPALTYTAHLGEGLTFSNGQSVAVATHGLFSMHRPEARKKVDYASFAPLWYIDPRNSTLDTNASYPSLQLNSNDMQFQTEVYSTFSGLTKYVQLVSGDCSSDLPFSTSSTTGYDLDSSDPYHGYSDVWANAWCPAPSFHDAPSTPGGTAWAYIDYNFKTYLRFKPAGTDSIFITLARISWSYQGSALKNNGIWTVSSDCPPPSFSNDNTFPAWIKTYIP